jgi:hypothetical protein
MTTRDVSSGLFTSHSMALAAKLNHIQTASPPPINAHPSARTQTLRTPLAPVPSRAITTPHASLPHSPNPIHESRGIDLTFHANPESRKTADLSSDPKTNTAFLDSAREWATVSTNRDLVRRHRSPALDG